MASVGPHSDGRDPRGPPAGQALGGWSAKHDRSSFDRIGRLMARRDSAVANDAGRARLELEFDQPYLLGPLFGDYDRHLITIEQRLGVHISARGNRVQIEGDAD